MYDIINVKSERITTKLRVLDYEFICDRTAKFDKKIFITRVYTYCSQALRRPELTL